MLFDNFFDIFLFLKKIFIIEIQRFYLFFRFSSGWSINFRILFLKNKSLTFSGLISLNLIKRLINRISKAIIQIFLVIKSKFNIRIFTTSS